MIDSSSHGIKFSEMEIPFSTTKGFYEFCDFFAKIKSEGKISEKTDREATSTTDPNIEMHVELESNNVEAYQVRSDIYDLPKKLVDKVLKNMGKNFELNIKDFSLDDLRILSDSSIVNTEEEHIYEADDLKPGLKFYPTAEFLVVYYKES